MLYEIIAYILSRQRLSAKTFVAGYFFMLCRIDCLCGCCATPLVSESCRHHHPTGSPFGHHPRLSMVCPRWGQWIETVVSIITPTKKNSFFVVTLSRRSKLADKQMLVGVTTKYLLSHVVILLSRL